MKIIIKILIFLIAVSLMIFATGGHALQFIDLATFVAIWLIACSLLYLHYEKGMKKPAIMMKLKKYLIFAGYITFLIGAILCMKAGVVDDVEGFIRNFAVSLLSIFWGYIFAYIIDAIYIKE